MATAPFDAELMTQQVAAVAVPQSHAFSTVRDENGALMMFSLGTNGVLYVFKDDVNGARVMVDLGAALGLPSGSSVTAFDVTQNPADSTLYLVVAAKTPSPQAGVGAAPQTDLLVLKPIAPSVIDITQPALNLGSYVIPNVGGGPTSISGILLVSQCVFLLGHNARLVYVRTCSFADESAGNLGG